jgi:hypothetical protein
MVRDARAREAEIWLGRRSASRNNSFMVTVLGRLRYSGSPTEAEAAEPLGLSGFGFGAPRGCGFEARLLSDLTCRFCNSKKLKLIGFKVVFDRAQSKIRVSGGHRGFLMRRRIRSSLSLNQSAGT